MKNFILGSFFEILGVEVKNLLQNESQILIHLQISLIHLFCLNRMHLFYVYYCLMVY